MIGNSNSREPDIVGEEFGGQWIAWDDDSIHIVAHGPSSEDVKQKALAAGVCQPTLEFVPPSDAAFVGGL